MQGRIIMQIMQSGININIYYINWNIYIYIHLKEWKSLSI